MPDQPPPSPRSEAPQIAGQAAAWLARRDRGLAPAEQDEFLQWLAADPRHAEAMSRHAAAFERMMTLYEWQPGQSAEPNPDLFAPRRRWRSPVLGMVLAAAAVLALSAGAWWRSSMTLTRPALAQNSYLRVNERHALPDGSIVELKDGSRIVTDFSLAERRVRLVGEGHFNVAPDAARPFIVDAEGVAVRAVGTAFNVRIDAEEVDVLVTEGSVRVHPRLADRAGPRAAADPADRNASVVSARQRVVVPLTERASPVVTEVDGAQIADALGWQAPRLQFLETPLAVAIAEFNQRNRTQIVLAETELRTVRIGGTFRVDNVEGFVRLLEATLEVRALPRGASEIVLTRAK